MTTTIRPTSRTRPSTGLGVRVLPLCLAILTLLAIVLAINEVETKSVSNMAAVTVLISTSGWPAVR